MSTVLQPTPGPQHLPARRLRAIPAPTCPNQEPEAFPAQGSVLTTNKDTTRRGSPSPRPPARRCQLSNSCERLLQTATASSLRAACEPIPGLQLCWVLPQTPCPVLSLCTVHMVSVPRAGSHAPCLLLHSRLSCSLQF